MLLKSLQWIRDSLYIDRARSQMYPVLPRVFLTFDDGPSPDFSKEILECLRVKDVKANFFLTGRNIEKYPEVVRQMAEAGHCLGNHFYTHQYLLFKSEAYLETGIQKTDALIRQSGYAGPIYFRPPHGVSAFRLPKIIKKMDKQVVFWNVDSRDYKILSVQQLCENITTSLSPGDIILMHDGRRTDINLLAALERCIDFARDRGLEFGRLSDYL